MPLHVSAAVSQAGADVVAWGCVLLLLLLLLLLPPGSGERGKISSTDRSFTLDRSLLSRFVSARSRVATALAAKKRAWAGLSLVTCPDVFNQVNTQEKEARVSQPGKREHHVSAA